VGNRVEEHLCDLTEGFDLIGDQRCYSLLVGCVVGGSGILSVFITAMWTSVPL
jgi:hypothetical protein